MKTLLKWFIVLLVLVVLGGIAAVFLVPKFVPVSAYKSKIEKIVAEKTGCSFSIGDKTKISVFPWLGLRLSDVQLGNPEGFTTENMVAAKNFEVRVKLFPLLSGNVEIDTFVLDSPRIFLEKSKSGLGNWQKIGPTAIEDVASSEKSEKKSDGEQSSLPISSLEVEHFSITNGVIQIVDKQAGTSQEITDFSLSLSNISLDKPIKMILKMHLDGQSVSVQGMAGPIGNPPGSKEMAVDLKVKALDLIDCTLKGRLTDPMNAFTFLGTLHLAPFSPKKLAAALKIDFPVQTTDPNVLEKVGFTGEFSVTKNAVSLSKSRLELDESLITFEGRVTEFNKPVIKAKLNLDSIDIDRYLPPAPEESPETASASASAPASEFKVAKNSVLRTMTLDAQITTGMLKVAHVVIDATKLVATGKSGVFTVEPATIDLYEGKILATARTDLAASPIQSRIEVEVRDVQVKKLLQDAAKVNKLEGVLKSHLVVAARGTNATTVLHSAKGQGNLLLNDGAIVGIDLASMTRNATSFLQGKQPSAQKARTDFSELSVPFTLTNGVATLANAQLKSPFIRLLANGTTNLLTQNLDVIVEPKIVGTIKGQGDNADHAGLLVPVRITGTFSDPKIRPQVTKDLQNALSNPNQLKKDVRSIEKKIKGIKNLF